MESLNPCLKLIWQVKKSIENGNSVNLGIKKYLESETGVWHEAVQCWFVGVKQGADVDWVVSGQQSPYRRMLLKVLERGLKGEAILTKLAQLEEEVQEKVEMDLEEYAQRVPYMLLMPLALFFFPACLFLMLGPFVLQLMQSF